jgi:transcriptional regulator with PAS, ATPase and Fis domain
MDETASLVSSDGAQAPPPRHWYLSLALEAARPHAGGQRIALAGLEELAIGRGATRSLVRDGARARFELDDRFQSRDQCVLRRAGEAWELVDTGSKNGTRVRGARTRRLELVDGDVIEAGASFFVVRSATATLPDLALAPPTGDGLRTLHAPLAAALGMVANLAPSPLPILIQGESGAGKERAARTIHELSQRRGPLVAVNCGAIPAGLVEAELFGARRGAYSGAVEDRIGLVRTAERGTLFLDEIADLPPPAQAALLRFVQEGEVRAVGAHHTLRVDTRIVAATHRDLDALVSEGKFRHDLVARLRGYVLVVPPLRDRREDLGVICADLLERMADPRGHARRFEPAAARMLFESEWPANVRELDHALRYAVARAAGDITADDLPEPTRAPAAPSPEPDPDPRAIQLAALFAEHAGNVSAIARTLGTSRSQVRRLLGRYRIGGDEPGSR